jgi:hypothetical protein
MAPQKGTRATLVKLAQVEEAHDFLRSLPEKSKEDLSLKDAIDQLREPLQAALAKGYSYQDLASQLEKQGINISATTLKNYLPSGRRGGKSPSTRKRAAKQVQPATTARAVESPASPPDSSTKQPGRKPKASAIATDPKPAESAPEKAPRRSSRAAKAQTNSTPTTRGTSTTRSKSSKSSRK